MPQLWILAVFLVLVLIANAIYNIWFHPLRNYPGPRYAAVSRLWYSSKVFGGHHKYAIKRLHDEYGMVVRIAPNELSYIDPRAWGDIYGKSAHEHSALEKEPEFFEPAFNASDSLVDSSSRDYKPQKKNATRAFSHGSLLTRSHTMSSYTDRSIDLLRTYLSEEQKSAVDINPWLGNIILDAHSKMSISRDFAAVDMGSNQHPVVTNMHKVVTVIQYCTQLQYLPRVLTSLPGLLPNRDIFTVLGNVAPLGPAISERLSNEKIMENQEEDFVSHMTELDGDGNISNAPTVRKNSLIFILSGVETLPGYICSILYYLLATPSYFARASEEVKIAFSRREEITLTTTQSLEFLRACMREGLRVSPPAVGTLPRRIPKEGATVCENLVPGGTTVGIHNWSITHSERFWKDPELFRPERWLGDEKYEDDSREVFKPFGVGPRTCVAQYLVLLESTLIVAKLLFDFDMSIDLADCGDWPVHQGHFVPTRGSLFIDLEPRPRERTMRA